MNSRAFDVDRCKANILRTIESAGGTIHDSKDQILFSQSEQSFILDILPLGETACISLVATNLTTLSENDDAALDYIHSFFSRRYVLVKAVLTSEETLNASFQSLACDERYWTSAVHEFAVGALLNARQDFFASLDAD